MVMETKKYGSLYLGEAMVMRKLATGKLNSPAWPYAIIYAIDLENSMLMSLVELDMEEIIRCNLVCDWGMFLESI